MKLNEMRNFVVCVLHVTDPRNSRHLEKPMEDRLAQKCLSFVEPKDLIAISTADIVYVVHIR
jgi:hypothetical protein